MDKNKIKTLLICKKPLYKSTYGKNAFTTGKGYKVTEVVGSVVWVTDNEGKAFSFSIQEGGDMYYLGTYFI